MIANIKQKSGFVIACLLAPISLLGQNHQTGVALSPVPLWPQNGDLSVLPKGQSLFYDPPSGEYVVCVNGDCTSGTSAEPNTIRYGSHSLVAPEVAVKIDSPSAGLYRYTYTVSNGKQARQAIETIRISISSNDQVTQSHPSWRQEQAVKKRDPFAPTAKTETLTWSAKSESESVLPGQSVNDFAVQSTSRPGFTTMSFQGLTHSKEFTPEDPQIKSDEVRKQLERVFTDTWDSKSRVVLGPRFNGQVPASEIVQNYLFGINSLIRDGALSRSQFVNDAIAFLNAEMEAGDRASLAARSLTFLDEARPGLEQTIAYAFRNALNQ